jgi:glycosyltransferase involved in cell wall biosynthesis
VKVLLLSHGFQAEYEAGFANGLAANGAQVTLLASSGTLFTRLDPRIDAPNLRGSQDPRRSLVSKVANLLRYGVSYLLRVAERKHDVVHNIGLFATGNVWLSLVEAAFMRLLARRFVFTVHNVLPHDRDTPLNRRLHRWLYRLPQDLVVHTPRTRDRLVAEFGVQDARITVMEHGIDRFPPLDPAVRASVRASLGLAEQDRLALFFGNLGWYKGPDIAIAAMGALPASQRWHLLIAGRCRHVDIRVAIAAQIAACAARDTIHWWERFVDDVEVPSIFMAADVLLMPYRRIEQSGVLFMALATGLPVVASDVGSFRDYVQRHAGAVVPAEDAPALALAQAGGHWPLPWPERVALARAAHAFDWRHTVRPVLRAYGVAPDVSAAERSTP